MKRVLINCGSILIFKLLIDFSYLYINSINYYSSRYCLDINLEKYVIGWLCIIISFLGWEYCERKDVSRLKKNVIFYYSIQYMYFLNFLPTCSYYGLANENNGSFSIFLLFWGLIYFMMVQCLNRFKIKEIDFKIGKNIGMTIYYFLIFLDIFIIFYENIKINGRLYIGISFSDVYFLRQKYGTSASTIEGILLFCFGGVINPYFALESFSKKKYYKFLMFCFVQVVDFGIAGHKAQIILIPVSLAVYYMFSKEMEKYISMLFSSFACFCVLILKIVRNSVCIDIFRRIFLTPSVLNFKYIQYFSNNKKIMGTEDMIIKRLISMVGKRPVYSDSAGNIIGYYWNSSYGGYCNNGIFGFAYADFGILGVVIYSFALVFALLLLDSMFRNVSILEKSIIIVVISMNVLSTSFSSLIYNVIIPFLLVAIVLSREKN